MSPHCHQKTVACLVILPICLPCCFVMLIFLFLIMFCSGGGILYCAALVIVLASALSALFCITFRLGTHHDVPIQVFMILWYANVYMSPSMYLHSCRLTLIFRTLLRTIHSDHQGCGEISRNLIHQVLGSLTLH